MLLPPTGGGESDSDVELIEDGSDVNLLYKMGARAGAGAGTRTYLQERAQL